MRNIGASKPLTMLLRVAILGISQGIATLVAVMLALLGCEVRTLMAVMLILGIAGIVVGDRATRPAREGGGSFPGTPPSRPKRAPVFRQRQK